MKILVLSRNPNLYSTQSIIQAGRQRGHYMKVIDHMLCDLVLDKHNLRVYHEGEEMKRIDAIIPRIGSSATVFGAAVIRQFVLSRVFTTLSSKSLLLARNKLSSLQLLASKGIAIPKSVICNNSYSLEPLLNFLGSYPKILKMLNSTHGLGVLQAHDISQATSLHETFAKLRQRMLLQEFIEESDGADIRVFIVNGEVIASMKRQAPEGEFRSNLHRGASAVPVDLSAAESRIALDAAKVLNLSVAGVDLLRSKRGPLILEVNPSPGLEGIETVTGIDVAGKIIEFVQSKNRKR